MNRMNLISGVCATAMMVLGGGCGGMEDSGVERGPLNLPKDISKADSAYSCKGHCGDQAPAGCWCDDACAAWGDCCPDKTKQCDAQPGKCIANKDCATGQYCHFADGACLLPTMTILEGVCQNQPENCLGLPAPVCGCDGQTYSNDCYARAAGVSVAHAGECPTKKTCGPFPGGECAAGQLCDIQSCGLGASGTCSPAPKCNTYLYEPVCGCDGKTYVNDCLRLTSGAAKAHAGECKDPCWGAWMDQSGNCRTPADGVYPDHCCKDERKQACAGISNDYADAVNKAKSCNPFIFTPQCQDGVPHKLVCGCPTFVNSKTSLGQHTTRWTQFRCDTVAFACPAVMCPGASVGVCDQNSHTCLDQ